MIPRIATAALISVFYFSLALVGCSDRKAKVGYDGHGRGSIDAATLAKYQPPKVDPELRKEVDILFDQRSSGSGIPSSDGERIYFSWRATGTQQIWSFDLDSKQLPRQLTSGPNRTKLLAVSPNEKWLALERDEGGEEYYGLYLMESKGSALRLVKAKPKVRVRFGFFSEDNRYLFFTANDRDPKKTSFYRFDLNTGKHTHLFTNDGTWYISDHRDNGNKLLLRLSRTSLATEIYEYVVDREVLRPLFGQGENSRFYARYGHYDSEIIVLTDHKEDFSRLYVWRRGDTPVGHFLPLNPRVPYDVQFFTIDPKRQRILYVENRGGYLRLKGINARTKQELRLPEIPNSRQLTPRDSSANSRFTIFASETDTRPHTYYLYDWQRKRYVDWSLPNQPEQSASSAIQGKVRYFVSHDKKKVPLVIYRSPRCEQFFCPVVVKVHGGPASQSRPRWKRQVQALAQNGFIVILPNVRGSSGYGREWRDADNGENREVALQDLVALSDWAKKEFTRSGKVPKIGITGGSYGGYSTLIMLAKYPNKYDAGFAYVGMTNLLSFLQNTAPHRRKLRAAEYGDPETQKDMLERLSPTNYLKQFSAPLVMAHGANDIRVPAGESVQLQRALEKAKPGLSELILYPDEGHGISKRKNRVHMTTYMVDFFRKHLQAANE